MTVSPTPVVAAGGIGDGRGLAATLALGASGVWCGTVFVATRESNVAEHWRQKILAATEEDTRISRVYTGKRMRVVRNPIVDAWERDKEPTRPMPLQAMLVEGLVWSAEQARMTDYVAVAAGQISGMLKEIKSAGQVVTEMADGAAKIIQQTLPESTGLSRRTTY